jgi:hypothetical protein
LPGNWQLAAGGLLLRHTSISKVPAKRLRENARGDNRRGSVIERRHSRARWAAFVVPIFSPQTQAICFVDGRASEDQPMTDKDDSRFDEGADDNASSERLSRRSFLVTAAALGATIEMDAGSGALAQSGSATGTRTPSSGEELVLYNGKVRTMDDRDGVVSAVRIRGNHFAEVGNFNASGPNAIDLGGRTVIPGLIESCDHIVSFGNYRLLRRCAVRKDTHERGMRRLTICRRHPLHFQKDRPGASGFGPRLFAKRRQFSGSEKRRLLAEAERCKDAASASTQPALTFDGRCRDPVAARGGRIIVREV